MIDNVIILEKEETSAIIALNPAILAVDKLGKDDRGVDVEDMEVEGM
jgi:hypothetical protein